MSFNVYHWCLVPECNNTSIKTPQKLWIQVPSDIKMRRIWLQLARRDPESLSTKSRLYFCEDHFDLENDMENYTRYKIMGSVKRIHMKRNCVPSRFDCQADRKYKCTPSEPRRAFIKRQRMSTIQEIEETMRNENYGILLPSCSQVDKAMDFDVSVKVEPEEDGPMSEETNTIRECLYQSEINVKIEPVELNPESEEFNVDFIVKEEVDIGPTEVQDICDQQKLKNVNCNQTEEYLIPQKQIFTKIEHNKNKRNSNTNKNRKKKEEKTNDVHHCNICSKSFGYIGNLKRHLKETHLKEPYTCDQCNKTFKRNKSLIRHQRSGVRCIVEKRGNIKCSCGRSFRHKGNMLRHKQGYCTVSQINDGVYICDLCQKVFPNRVRLSVHISHHKRINKLKS